MVMLLVFLCFAYQVALGKVFDFEKAGGVPDKLNDVPTAQHNGALLNTTLAQLQSGDTLVIPAKTFHVMGGIKSSGLRNVVIRIDGILDFSDSIKDWPRNGDGRNANVLECIELDSAENVTITSNAVGVLKGNGKRWWGLPGIGYLVHKENRPRLLKLSSPKDVLIENILFKDSPYWTFWAPDANGLEIRHCEIDNKRRDSATNHNIWELTAFNTDGFDITGKNVWIHDAKIWCQDDTIAVKDGSENMLFERINASGVGLTIGSIGGSRVNNITFRDSVMYNTYKGIYMKFRRGDAGGVISNIMYSNITINNPSQWAVWIGPAQQSDSKKLCAANGGCSICWPLLPERFGATCEMGQGLYENITLKDITINGAANDNST